MRNLVEGLVNARFWEWINGSFVKITLRPGQTLRWHHGEQTEEGWASIDEEWHYNERGNEIVNRCEEDERDCDGRFQTTSKSTCDLNFLREGYQPRCLEEPDQYSPVEVEAAQGVIFPKWIKRRAGQRDFEAEKMGY